MRHQVFSSTPSVEGIDKAMESIAEKQKKGTESDGHDARLRWGLHSRRTKDVEGNSEKDIGPMPDTTSGLLSAWTYAWLDPLLRVGYKRPLQDEDLWRIDQPRRVQPLAERFLATFEARRVQAEVARRELIEGTRKASWTTRLACARRAMTLDRSSNDFLMAATEKAPSQDCSPSRAPSTIEALPMNAESFHVLARFKNLYRAQLDLANMRPVRPSVPLCLLEISYEHFIKSGIYRFIAEMSQIFTPIVAKYLINFARDSYNAKVNPASSLTAPSIGLGIGYVVIIVLLSVLTSLFSNRGYHHGSQMGSIARSVIMSSVYRKAMTLTARARLLYGSGRLTSLVTSDVSRLDQCAQRLHMIWTTVIQIVVLFILIMLQIGILPTLCGFAVLIILVPLQILILRLIGTRRVSSLKYTDARIDLISEMLLNAKALKLFTCVSRS